MFPMFILTDFDNVPLEDTIYNIINYN